MSNRLKRKLDQSAADPGNDSGASGNLLESFVQYGTALPSLEKKDKNEYVPVWQQTVTDEQGRRRLHGAFTGGFSAGYFNSVGSAEGWTPSNFVSSRNNRAKYSQSAKDFMDDEDLADAKDEQVTEVSQDPTLQQQKQLGSAESASEDKLVHTIRGAQDRAGHALLKRMGWREGQGAGPRLSAQGRQRMAVELGLGHGDEHDWTATAAPGQTFAPLDRPLVHFQAKDNQYGLGYTAAMRLDEDLGRNGRATGKDAKLRTQEGNTSMPVGGAFGISALEDADDDDYSVYEGASSSKAGGQRSSKLSRMMEEDEEDQPRMASRHPAKPRQPQAPVPSTAPESSQTYLDNTPVLPGFSMSRAAPTPDSWFAPPAVPAGWAPDPKRVMALAPSSNEPSSEVLKGQPPPKLDARGKPVLSADDRAAMLSDAPAKARSVFDFISKKNQERISAAKAAGHKVSEPELEPEPARPQIVELEVPELDKNIAQAALKGFMPYGDDLNKQARYRLFLQAAAGFKEDEGVFRPKAELDRVEELNKELADFKKSAMVFKPMSKAMASRFTGSSSVATAKDMAQPGQPGLAFVSTSSKSEDKSGETDEAASAQASSTETDDPVINAVRMGMFGPLTRKTSDFYPNKLLCKRFGCRQPHPEGPSGREDEENDQGARPDEEKNLLNNATMEELRKQSGYAPPVKPVETSSSSASTLAPSTSGGPNKPAKALGSVGLGEDDTQGQDILTYERPPMDLFKAIFADSDDDDDEQGDGDVAGPSKADADQHSELTRIVTAPPSAATKANLEPVSFADFKPTFVRRPQQEASAGDKPKVKKKKEKKSKGKGATLSFDIDDGEGGEADGAAPKLQKEKRKKSSKSADGQEDSSKSKKVKREQGNQVPTEEEEEWVEKEVAPPAAIAPAPAPGRARARAADLF